MLRRPLQRALPACRTLLVGLTIFLAQAAAQAQPEAAPARLPDDPTTPTVFENVDLVQRYQSTITAEDLAAHLYFFASDFFEGRETTTRGQKLAAHYLAAQYRKMGLAPRGTAGVDNPDAPEQYFQPFPLIERRFASAALTIRAGGETASSWFGLDRQDEKSYLHAGSEGAVEGGVVFGGYGIADRSLGYDDYDALDQQGIALNGKWLLVLDDEPLASAERSLLPTPDRQPSDRWSMSLSPKYTIAVQKGAAGLLVVGDVGPLAPENFDTVVHEQARSRQAVGQLSLAGDAPARTWQQPPIYFITSELADRLLAPSGRTVAALKAEIDAGPEPVVFEIDGAHAVSAVVYETRPVESENVLAFLEGGDPDLKDEVVVVSSHYDHEGMRLVGEGDRIYNGADDDGSGTVAILEIAEAFARAAEDGYRPRRSILFLNVSAEEKGLLGSRYYTDVDPVFPLGKTVANLNIDMIGRFDPTYPDPATAKNYVYIIGSNLISQELHDINERVNRLTGTSLTLNERFNSKTDPQQFYRRSDHWNFGKHNIPFIFFFTGTHDDYHQPGDEAHKIAYDRLARISRLIFATAWQLANQDLPPAVSGVGFN